MCSTSIIFITGVFLVVVLSGVFTECRHLRRHSGKDYELARLKRKLIKYEHLLNQYRSRRDISNELDVNTAANKGLCKYDVIPNKFEEHEVKGKPYPDSYDEVICKEKECNCKGEGTYSCIQLTSEITLTYFKDNVKTEDQQRTVKSGCICGVISDITSAAPLLPRIVPNH